MVNLTPSIPPSGEVNLFQDFAVKERSPFDLAKLSDKFRQRATDWTIPEAYLALIMAATTADGCFDAKERETFLNVVRRSRALSTVPAEVMSAAERNVQQRAQSRTNWLGEACETLPSDMRLSVFAHCVDIVLSDGELLEVESKFLNDLARMLELPIENARRVMEVLLLKAQY